MDRSLDESIAERRREANSNDRYRSSRDRRPPRDGIQKSSQRTDSRALQESIDSEWVHDRYNDEDQEDPRQYRQQRGRFPTEHFKKRPVERDMDGYRLKVENLHFEIDESDLRSLFERIGPVSKAWLLWDGTDRSTGTGYVVYEDIRYAAEAIREFDGHRAMGQPIHVTLLPPPKQTGMSNPSSAPRPSRSLFDRVEPRNNRTRSLSPDTGRTVRRTYGTTPTASNVDRYIPDRTERSPLRRGNGPRSRRPGERRQPRRDEQGHPIVQGRPRKTTDELDAEMAEYWAENKGDTDTAGAMNGGVTATVANENPPQMAPTTGDDEEMMDLIE